MTTTATKRAPRKAAAPTKPATPDQAPAASTDEQPPAPHGKGDVVTYGEQTLLVVDVDDRGWVRTVPVPGLSGYMPPDLVEAV